VPIQISSKFRNNNNNYNNNSDDKLNLLLKRVTKLIQEVVDLIQINPRCIYALWFN